MADLIQLKVNPGSVGGGSVAGAAASSLVPGVGGLVSGIFEGIADIFSRPSSAEVNREATENETKYGNYAAQDRVSVKDLEKLIKRNRQLKAALSLSTGRSPLTSKQKKVFDRAQDQYKASLKRWKSNQAKPQLAQIKLEQAKKAEAERVNAQTLATLTAALTSSGSPVYRTSSVKAPGAAVAPGGDATSMISVAAIGLVAALLIFKP